MKLVPVLFFSHHLPNTPDTCFFPAVQRQGAREEAAKKDGSVGLISGLSVSSLLLIVAAVGYLV